MSDTTDDLEYYLEFQDDSENERRERRWRNGFHTTNSGETLKLSEMETSHLENTIKYFNHLDTSPLKKELARRLNKQLY